MKQLKKLGIIYVSLIAIFIIAMVGTYMIPNKRINWHVSESLNQLKIEGVYQRLFFDTPAAQLDNFTDSWMLNLAVSADGKEPLKSAMKNPHRSTLSYSKGEIDKVEDLEGVMTNKDYEVKSYSRYWHGYLTILRPLLVLFSYTEIRYINMFVLGLLFIITNMLVKKKLGMGIMISFFASIMMTMFIIVPMSLQFSSLFYITFISMIILLYYDKQIKEHKLGIYIFFIIGSITSFLDLLTAPVMTLGIPLVTYILLCQKNNEIKINPIINTIEIIKMSIVWALGYGLTWATKWVVASIILKENVVSNALNQILARTSDTSWDIALTAKAVIEKNEDIIYTDFILKFIPILIIFWLIGIIFYRKEKQEILNILPLFLIAIIPYAWYTVLKNHSYIHYWFTYRSLAVTTFSVLAFFVYSIDYTKIVYKLRELKTIK